MCPNRVVLLQCSPHHSNSVLYPVGGEPLSEFEREDTMKRTRRKLIGQCGRG